MENRKKYEDYTKRYCQKIHLKKVPDSKQMYLGTVSEFDVAYSGENNDIEVPGIFLSNIVDEKGNNIPSQWFNIGKTFIKANPKIGDRLRFNASMMTFNQICENDTTKLIHTKHKLGYVQNVKKLRSVVRRLESEE